MREYEESSRIQETSRHQEFISRMRERPRLTRALRAKTGLDIARELQSDASAGRGHILSVQAANNGWVALNFTTSGKEESDFLHSVISSSGNSWKDLKEHINRNEHLKNGAIILSQLNMIRQQVLDMDPEEPGKVIDESALHIVRYFMKELTEGNSFLIRHSTDLKRIFGGNMDQSKTRKFYQVSAYLGISQQRLI